MMTIHTTVMSIHAATKLIPLLAIVDDKEQRTDNINNNPLPAKFQWNLLQSTIFAACASTMPLIMASITL